MKHLIISYAGKQAGKTSSCTAMYGYLLCSKGIIPNCNFDPSGRMSVVYNKDTNEGIYFDIDDNSPEMVEFKQKNVWAHIKHNSFADALKESIIRLFGISRDLIYGTDEDKNTLTHIMWDDVFPLLTQERAIKNAHKAGTALTIRELCQVFGTDMCRAIDENCHLRSAVQQSILDNPEVGYIPDGRFANEFFYFDTNEAKGLLKGTKVWRVKYTRNSHPDNPPGEQGLPEVDNSLYDLVIDNHNMTTLEKNEIFINFFIENGVLCKTGVKIK